MPRLFVAPRILTQANLLDDYMQRRLAFNPQDLVHLSLIENCAVDLSIHLRRVQAIDKQIVAALALGFSALALSTLLPVGIIAVTSIAYAAYAYGTRQTAYKEYQQALDNLVKCCIWSLGQVEDQGIRNLAQINLMIETLAPLTSENQLRDFIDDAVEEGFVQDAEEIRARVVAFDERLNQEQVGLFYGLYGYQQGSFSQVFNGLRYIVAEGFRTLKEKVQSLFDGAHVVAHDVQEPVLAHR